LSRPCLSLAAADGGRRTAGGGSSEKKRQMRRVLCFFFLSGEGEKRRMSRGLWNSRALHGLFVGPLIRTAYIRPTSPRPRLHRTERSMLLN
jgi:hypothetical protein